MTIAIEKSPYADDSSQSVLVVSRDGERENVAGGVSTLNRVCHGNLPCPRVWRIPCITSLHWPPTDSVDCILHRGNSELLDCFHIVASLIESLHVLERLDFIFLDRLVDDCSQLFPELIVNDAERCHLGLIVWYDCFLSTF